MMFEYDSWNRVQRIVYPDSEVVSYGYDLGGQLLVAADLMFSASLSKHPMDVSSYDAVEFRDFKSQYATVADYKSATTDRALKKDE